MTHAAGLPRIGAGVVESHAAMARESGRALDSTILRHPTRAGLDVLAHLATEGDLTYRELTHLISEARHAPGVSLARLARMDAAWMERLARVLALMDAAPRDRPDAYDILRFLADTRGVSALSPHTVWLYAQLALFDGDSPRVRSVLKDGRLVPSLSAALEADLSNPFGPGADEVDPAEWVQHFSRVLALPEDEQLTLRPEDGTSPPFDRVEIAGPLPPVDGPLVTVVLTSYRPGPDLLTAVRSIRDQTWQNLECLIVDDASPESYARWLDRAAALDDRVRVLRLSENGGTYRARNAGLDAAAGGFVTFQDVDDWSHPRRVELQMKPMLGEDRIKATWSRCVRVDDRMLLAEMRQTVLRSNESSLCFRRDVVMERIGYFDALRKGADSEYRQRIVAAFDGGVKHLADTRPLALIRRTSGSLSRDEFRSGWRHRARFAYRAAYDRWHKRIVGGADPYVASGTRPSGLPAPLRMIHGRDGQPRLEKDVVVVADWRDGVGNDAVHAAACGEIRALAAAGLEVGIAHVQPLYNMSPSDDHLGETFYSLLEAGCAQEILLDDEATVGVVSLHEPAWLQFPPLEAAAWTVRTVHVVDGLGPIDGVNGRVRYLSGECTEAARRLFGAGVEWHPRTASIEHTLARAGEPGVAVAETNYRVVYPCGDPNAGARQRRREGAAVVGRWSKDDPLAFPANAATLRAVYDTGAGTPLLVGGRRTVSKLLRGSIPGAWTVLPEGAMRFEDLLGEVDVLVHVNDARDDADLDWMVLLAVERGVPVVLPHRYHDHFGPTVAYASAHDMRETVAALGPEGNGREEHVATARKAAQKRWTPAAYLKDIRRSIDGLATDT